MLQRQLPIEHAAPWLVSSISGYYVIVRARRLSLAQSSEMPLLLFLLRQSDLILLLCSGPALWYVVQQRYRNNAQHNQLFGEKARALHQLRQVFTALLIGTGLLERKAAAGKVDELAPLAQRLNNIVREGADTLTVLGEPYASDLLDERGMPIDWRPSNNGLSS